MKDLTISIGTIDRFDMLERCLQSVYEGTTATLGVEVVVVVNGARDETVPDRIRARFPAVTVLTAPTKLGFCRMHNLVMRRSESRYVLLLDDDTVLAPDTLRAMVDFMDAHPDVGIVGPRTVHPDGRFQKTYGLRPDLRTEFLNAFKLSSYWPERLYRDLHGPREVDWLNGSFLLVRSAAMHEVGLLDEHYYTYVCEPDWCYRMQARGWKVMFVPEVTIVHACGEHSIYTASRRYVDIVRAHVNRFYFFHRHHPPSARALVRPIMAGGALVRILFYGGIALAVPVARREAWTRLRGFWRVARLSVARRPWELPKELREPGELDDQRPSAIASR